MQPGAAPSRDSLSNLEMGVQSFDNEIVQVKSRDRADWYFAPNNTTLAVTEHKSNF